MIEYMDSRSVCLCLAVCSQRCWWAVKSMLWKEMEIEVAEYLECGKESIRHLLWK